MDSAVVTVLEEALVILAFGNKNIVSTAASDSSVLLDWFRCLPVTCDHPPSLFVECLSQNFHCFVASTKSRKHINDTGMMHCLFYDIIKHFQPRLHLYLPQFTHYYTDLTVQPGCECSTESLLNLALSTGRNVFNWGFWINGSPGCKSASATAPQQLSLLCSH